MMLPFWGHGLLMVVLHALDIATTRVALSLGAGEANPLMARHVESLGRMIVIKGMAVTLVLSICFWLNQLSPERAIPLLWLLHGIVLGVVVTNGMAIYTIRREQATKDEEQEP